MEILNLYSEQIETVASVIIMIAAVITVALVFIGKLLNKNPFRRNK